MRLSKTERRLLCDWFSLANTQHSTRESTLPACRFAQAPVADGFGTDSTSEFGASIRVYVVHVSPDLRNVYTCSTTLRHFLCGL